MKKFIVLSTIDNVATALKNLNPGETIRVNSVKQEIEPINNIPKGHKFAIKKINKGEDVIKYGHIIGEALDDISIGDHVHQHNIRSVRGKNYKTGDEEREIY